MLAPTIPLTLCFRVQRPGITALLHFRRVLVKTTMLE